MDKRVIVITGGSSGIGLQTVRQLAAEENNHIISFSRSEEKMRKALKEIGEKDNINYFGGDITKKDDCQKFAQYVEANYGKLHGLVNNAGIITNGGIEMIDYETWKYNLEVNLNGVYLFTRCVLPLLRKAQGASVVNVSSVASFKPGRSIAYSVSKAGLDMLTEFLAGDLAPYKIRVNSVNPGLVVTPLHLDNKIFDKKAEYEEMLNKSAEKYPLRRIGKPGDIANLIEFLLSDKASWITGSIMKIDGGVTISNDLIPPKENN